MAQMHASCVAIGGQGILLTGPSGSGKSDLALRLIAAGAELVADDQVILWKSGNRLFGRSPDTIRGLIESRGVGIKTMPYRRFVEVWLQVSLVPIEAVERLPDGRDSLIEGVKVRCVDLYAFSASAPLKVMAALKK